MSTTLVALFLTSGYTTNALIVRSPDLMFTHSRCRGDFSSAIFAQFGAGAGGAVVVAVVVGAGAAGCVCAIGMEWSCSCAVSANAPRSRRARVPAFFIDPPKC